MRSELKLSLSSLLWKASVLLSVERLSLFAVMTSSSRGERPHEALREALERPHVHLADREALQRKMRKFCRDGPDRLLVLSDFDMTLTNYWVNGRRGYTSYAVIEYSSRMPEEYRQKAVRLKEKYDPIEFDHQLSHEEREKAMEEWWDQAHNLQLSYGLTQDTIAQMVTEANIALRSGCDKLFSELDEAGVPLLIFSAGLADPILETLRQLSSIRPNMTVISNKIIFNEEGVATAFSEPVIHSCNKGHGSAQFTGVLKDIKGRGNVVVLGDSLGDPHMTSGLQGVECEIKIGFLNAKEDVLLPTYLQLYDVVLTGDPGMDVPATIVAAVLNAQNGFMNS